MTDKITIGNLYPNTIQRAGNLPKDRNQNKRELRTGDFKQILNDNMLKFSHHAEIRLQQRGIHLQTEQLKKMNQMIDKMDAKGAKDSLILMNGTAFIVNVKNRTVITAVDPASLKEHVFTQIDSAVVI